MKIKVISQVYCIYERAHSGKLTAWPSSNPVFETEADAVKYIERFGVETGDYVIRMES